MEPPFFPLPPDPNWKPDEAPKEVPEAAIADLVVRAHQPPANQQQQRNADWKNLAKS